MSKEQLGIALMAKQANYEAFEHGRKEPAKGAVEPIAAGVQAPQQSDFLNLVLESLPHPFYVIDCLDYTIKLANSSAHKGMLAKGVTCYALTHKSDRPCSSAKHPCPLEVVKKTKEPIIVEHVHYDEHGHLVNVEVHAAPIFDAQGNVSQIIEYAMDVTERKRTEQALLQREEYFRSLIENSSDAIMIVDQNAIIRYLSPSLERVLGYKPQDLIGLNTTDFIHPEDLAGALGEFSQLLKRQGVTLSSEFRFKHRRGSWRVLEVRTTNLLNNPSVLGIVVNMRDITKRRRAQHELLQSEGHLRSLMESASNFVVYRLARDKGSPSGFEVVFASPSISEILAVPDPMKYETWFENIHPDDLNKFVEASQRASKTLNFDVSMRIYHPEKEEWRWIQAIATGAPNRDGGTYYANGIIIDITERKKAEEELEIKTKNLEEVNTALKVLLKRREEDKAELEQKVMANIDELVAPYLAKIKKGVNDEKTKTYLSILESSLNTITSPFARKMSSKYLNLTSAEIEVANFVRHGKSTKEIAELLNLSGKTIETHRMNIRKKLGITNKKANLRTYLQSFH